MKPSEDAVAIELAGENDTEKIPLHAFTIILNSVRAMFASLDKQKTAVWRIDRIQMNSPGVVEFGAIPTNGKPVDRGIGDNFMGVMRSLSTSSPPPRVPPSIVARGRSILNTMNKGVGRMRLTSAGREPIIAPRRPLEDTRVVQDAVTPVDYENYAHLEGILCIIGSVSQERMVQLIDRLNGHVTNCVLSEPDFILALEAMKLPGHAPRVAVDGRTSYTKNRPTRVKVDRFTVFPQQDDKAIFYAVQGIDITGGVDSVEFVRSQWE